MHLVIPVGTIFGARNSPSFYMEAGETRSHLAGSWPDATSLPLQDLVEQVVLPPSPTPAEAAAFAQAIADSQHQGIANPTTANPERRLPSFVDDSCTAHVSWYFRTAINVVVWAASIAFGFPSEDPTHPPCINPIKWIKDAAVRVKFLGFLLDTRQMRVIWPLNKQAKLSALLLELFLQQSPPHRRGSTPQSIAKILGLLRHGAMVAPLGTLQTLRLQFFLNDIVSKAPAKLRRWWQGIRLVLPCPIINDLRQLQSTLLSDELDPRWSRLIGLIIPRDPTHISRSDASMNGMGAWSADLPHMRRLSMADLKVCAIPTHGRHNPQHHEPKAEQAPAHINTLEFFGIFIKLWFLLRSLKETYDADPTTVPPGGFRILALANNTSALSWLQHATRTKHPVVRRLARLLTAFLSSPFPAAFVRVQGKHLPGLKNTAGSSLPILTRTIVGIRYATIPPSSSSTNMPSPARRLVLACLSNQQRTDRGLVRNKNDRTMDSQASAFRSWLFTTAGYSDITLPGMTEPDALAVLATYLDFKARTALNPQTSDPIQAKTLNNHLQAAAAYLRLVTSLSVSIMSSSSSSNPRLTSFFADILRSRAKWAAPHPKRLPYTHAMFQALASMVKEHLATSKSAHLDLLHTVFDWICLGVFTGSRSGKYAQTTAPKGSFAKVPDSWAPPPKWRNQPLVFLLSDFTLLDENLCVMPPHDALKNPKRCCWLQIRYRFDKSTTNFSLRRYCRGKGFLCPAFAALSIIRRATTLQVPCNEPLGVYRSNPTGSYTYLRSSEIITVMRQAVTAACPNPLHHHRINIKAVIAHSNRVTAAEALFSMKLSIEDVAFRLRWKPESVQRCIRECSQFVDDLTAATISGAAIL